jgi:hypothetical protein
LALKSLVKAIIVSLALWRVLPVPVATFLIEHLGLVSA